MNRLLEGDVGSGKTVVAAIAMYVAFLNNYQSILMAPTEILAEQHYQTINTLLSQTGAKIELITSSTKKIAKKRGHPDIAIGTHALLWERELGAKVGLVVVDEQHRFGVDQRQKLKEKGVNPHLLSMTATPIPRTTALTLYGELDLSIIDEMPGGRALIKTWVVPGEKRNSAYQWIDRQIKETGGQVFIICPLIEESETLDTTKAAKKEYEYIKTIIFPNRNVGLIHGKQSSKEKQKVLREVREGKIEILVATPVVEVGIDIPNAIIMVVEAADRFGLAQLHQLRGRVGRGTKQSYCLLFSENQEPETLTRLKAMETNFIGSKLAELDLRLRGPGEISGTRQHGRTTLKIADLSDNNLIKKTLEAVKFVLNNLNTFPLLHEEMRIATINRGLLKRD
jgi:ATP-dependent DNA helicase RecG